MGITPKKNGFVQDTYADFMGQAANGMLAFASDIDLTDGVFVGDVAKAYAGRCYGLKDGSLIALDASSEPVVVVLQYGMDSDDDGSFANEVAKVIRSNRVGGRIWCEVIAKGASVDSTAALHVNADGKLTDASDGVDVSAHIKVVGSFVATDGKALCLVEVM